MSHTPGPWITESSANDDEAFWVTAGDKVVCAVMDSFDNDRDASFVSQEDIDNAALIAAAPDLFAACKHILSASSYDAMDFGILESAVAKAEGKP